MNADGAAHIHKKRKETGMKRVLTGLAAGAIAVGASLAVAPTANAAPPPHLALTGYDVLIPPNGDCHGTLQIGFEELPGMGNLRVHANPTGTWGSASNCSVRAMVSIMNGIAPGAHTHDFYVAGGHTSTDVHVGGGLSQVGVNTTEPFGFPVSNYVWMNPLA